MTPEPAARAWRGGGSSGRSKKGRKKGSRNSGFSVVGTPLTTEMLTTAGVARSRSGAMVITPRAGSSAGYWAQAVPGTGSVAATTSTASSRTATAARSRAPVMGSHPSGTGRQHLRANPPARGAALRHRPGAAGSGGCLDLDPLGLPLLSGRLGQGDGQHAVL